MSSPIPIPCTPGSSFAQPTIFPEPLLLGPALHEVEGHEGQDNRRTLPLYPVGGSPRRLGSAYPQRAPTLMGFLRRPKQQSQVDGVARHRSLQPPAPEVSTRIHRDIPVGTPPNAVPSVEVQQCSFATPTPQIAVAESGIFSGKLCTSPMPFGTSLGTAQSQHNGGMLENTSVASAVSHQPDDDDHQQEEVDLRRRNQPSPIAA